MEKWEIHKWKFGIKACQALDAKSFGRGVIYFIHFFPFTNSYSLTHYCEPALVLGARERPGKDMVPALKQLTTTCDGTLCCPCVCA